MKCTEKAWAEPRSAGAAPDFGSVTRSSSREDSDDAERPNHQYEDDGVGIVARSLTVRRVLQQVRMVAKTDATVLIHGETGTGKELIARALHFHSGRRGAFVKLNCAAVPGNLLESELMGHERGAFTGAYARRIGRFEVADGGTLLLDEIGEMPLDVQPKVLRLVQEREFERLGSNQTIRSSARLVAATNRDLRQLVEDREFREDLYYRLNVFPIGLPPLRERREDIPELARHFADAFSRRSGRPTPRITPGLEARLCAYDWPGNIRELMNVVERAIILASDGVLASEAFLQLPDARPFRSVEAREPSPHRVSERLDDVEREHIVTILDATNWVIGGPRGAAHRLGIKRTTLVYRMKKLRIERSRRHRA